MTGKVRANLTYANVMATVAVFLALGGGAIAATHLGKNVIGTKQIKNNAVNGAKIQDNAVNGAKIQDQSLTAADISPSSLNFAPAGLFGSPGGSFSQGAVNVSCVLGELSLIAGNTYPNTMLPADGRCWISARILSCSACWARRTVAMAAITLRCLTSRARSRRARARTAPAS